MDRGWNDTTCSGPERSRLGQQPYDRGRVISNDPRRCFGCGQEGHIAKSCPRNLERMSGGIYRGWPHEHWPQSRPPTSFHKDSSYSRGESNRENNSYGRRAPFDSHDQSEHYYRPRDVGGRMRENESSWGLDIGGASNSNARERESRSSRSSGRKPQDVPHHTTVEHRRDEHKGGKEERKEEAKDEKSQRMDTRVEAKFSNSSNGVVTSEGNGEVQRGVQVSKLSPRGSHSESAVMRKDGNSVAEDGARSSTKDGGHQKAVSGSDLHGSVSDKDRCRRSDNGGKRGQKCSREELARVSDTSSSRSNSKVPLSVLCSKAIENGPEGITERKASTDNSSLIFVPEIENALPRSSFSGNRKELKAELHPVGRETDSSSVSMPHDLKEQEILKTFESPNRCKSNLPSGVFCPKVGQGGKEREIVVEVSVVADAKMSSACEDGQSRSGKGRRTTRWDEGEALADDPSSAEKNQSRDLHKVDKSAVSIKDTAADVVQQADESQKRDSVKDEKHTVSNKGPVLTVVPENGQRLDAAKEEKKGPSSKDMTVDASESLERHSPPCKGVIAEQDNKRTSECYTSHVGPRALGNDGSDGERNHSMVQSESGPSSWHRRRAQIHKERNHEPDWREQESGYEGRGRECEVDRHVIGFERGQEKEILRRHTEHSSSSPSRRRNGSRERDSTHDAYTGYGSREVSIDRFSERNGHSTYIEGVGQKHALKPLDVGLKAEYRRRFETTDGKNGFGNSVTSEHRKVEDNRGWGTEWRHLRSMETQSVRSQFRPPYAHLIGAHYSCVVNARWEPQRSPSPMAISPSPFQSAAIHQDPLSSGQGEETNCVSMESLSRGWLYNDRHGNLQGPVELEQLREMLDSGLLQADHLVRREETNEWVTLEHAGSPANCLPSSPGNKQASSLSSSGMSQASPPCYPTFSQVRLLDEHLAAKHAEHDICPPGTEMSKSTCLDGDFEDLHIDERVEKLMQGFTYIPGKEGEAVYEALSSAAMRVRAALGYETDQLNEESPRSHGGFANLGDQWKDGDFGSDVQGLDAGGSEQHGAKADEKSEEKGTEVVSEARVEVVSVPKPPPLVPGRKNRPVEKRPELWTWPARGGDWKLYVFPVENAQPVIGEKGPQVPMIAKKVVLNGGHPFCDGKFRDARDQRRRDPRRLRELQNQAEESSRHNVVIWGKLEVPKFALAVCSKVGITPDEANVPSNQHLVTTPKGTPATTPNLQTFTPSAHLGQGRSVIGGVGGGLKGTKSSKPSSTAASAPGTSTKSVGQAIHPQTQSKSERTLHQSGKNESLLVKKNATTSKYRGLPRPGGLSDGRMKPVVERIIKQSGRAEATLRDRSCDHQQGFDGEVLKVAPKQMFSRKDLPSTEALNLKAGKWFYLDGMGHEAGPFLHAEVQGLVLTHKLIEGSTIYRKDDDTWVPVSKTSLDGTVTSPDDPGILCEDGLKVPVVIPAANQLSESSARQSSLEDRTRYSPSEPLPPAVTMSESSVLTPVSKECGVPSTSNTTSEPISFYEIHPQFLGFTRGKLHEYVMKSFKGALLPAALYEGLEKWFQAKEKEKVSVVPPLPQGSPQSSVPTPGVERSRDHDDAGICSPRYDRQFQSQSTLTGRPSAHGTPSSSYDDATKTVEVEAWSRAAFVGQNVRIVGEEFSPSKRKAWAVEDSKHHRKSSQKRRLLDSEESDGDEKAGHSSRGTRVGASSLPRLVDDNPFKTPDILPQVLLSGVQETCWATLNFGTLRTIFRCLRGDVRSLLNASATCKTWMAAGKICKTELKLVDLSCLRGSRLDALLEALPGFGAASLRRLNLKGCKSVKPESLAELLRACPSISAVDIDSLEPFRELRGSFPKVRWVTDQSGEEREGELVTGKRSEVHFKTRSLKGLGESKGIYLREAFNRECEDVEVNLVSDSASKVRTSSEYGCTLTTDLETVTNDSVYESEITQSTRTSDGAKQFKLSNWSKKLESSNGYSKSIKRESGDGISHEMHLKRKPQTMLPHRKHEKASYKGVKQWTGSQRAISYKVSASTAKTEFPAKGYAMMSMLEGEKSLEKEITAILRAMIEADTGRIFQPANAANDSKGGVSNSGKMDLMIIERKFRSGSYSSGKSGFKAFREDVNLLTRIAFRNPKESLIYTTGEKIFKLAHSCFSAVENQFAGQCSVENQTQSKSFGARPFGKGEKGRLKAPSTAQHRPGKKRRIWHDDGVQKGKFLSVKKGRQGDWSDVDSYSDSERDIRRFSKSKKERSWESDGGHSSDDEEDGFMEEDEEETETEPSDSDIPSESEGEDGFYEADTYDSEEEQEMRYRDWGARMTKAAMVPPVTRKYVVIEEYRIVADKERVEKKMRVELPKNFSQAAIGGDPYSHLDYPEVKEYQPRKRLGEEVTEQEVYGIDPFTHNLLLDTMPVETTYLTEAQKQQFIEERLLLVLNKEGRQYTGTGKAPMEYPLDRVVQRIASEAEICKDWALYDFADQLLVNMRGRQQKEKDLKFVAYRKGLGVVCNKPQGLEKDEFVVEFFGEVYPPWRWYEKQDGIRSLQKKDKDPTPEFYNIYYERPKGDAAGYDLLVVDAMHKANFASRLCHSCRPNCEAKITAVNNTYIIGVYSLKPIKRGEELTFDYNSVTESKEEYNNAVCLCGSQGCRGSYLNLTGSGTFEEVIATDHDLLERHRLLLNSCTSSAVTDEEMDEMRQAGLGTCVLSGLPDWAVKYTASLVHFMNFEKTHLPAELLKDYDAKKKQGIVEGASEVDAEITTEGVYNQRLQNLTITLDKVRHILAELYQKPSLAPPPVRRLDQREMVQWIWKKENSVVNELLQCLAPHLQRETLSEFKAAVGRNAPNDSGNNLHNALIWLRDALRRLPATFKARHDAAADLIHLYAYTKCFFVLEDYGMVESPPVLITPLDLGSKHSLTGNRQWSKVYGKEYVWGQLINWFKQNVADPGASLAKTSRGCLVLPDISSCYSKSMQHDFRQGYGPKHREKMIFHMEHKPQQKWPKSKLWSQFWSFRNERGLFGSPMLDSVLEGRPLREDMMRWLKLREINFVGPWDEQ